MGIAQLIQLLLAATQAISTIAPIIAAAQAQGRTTLTDAEWATVIQNDDSAGAQLLAAFTAAKAAGK
jgi:hypothetical protein